MTVPISTQPTVPESPRISARGRVFIACAVGAALILGIFLLTHPLSRNGFKVGECATVEPAALSGWTMHHADCPGRNSSPSLANLVYRVDRVMDGKDGHCAGGLSRMTFSNEPEDTTYCLSMVFG